MKYIEYSLYAHSLYEFAMLAVIAYLIFFRRAKRSEGCNIAPAPGSVSGFWQSPRGENHGLNSKPGDMWCKPGEIHDTDRIEYLTKLLTHYTHAEIIFNDDDVDEPIGFTIRVEAIRVEGCEKSEVTAPTLREVIDKDMLKTQNQRS